MRGAGKERRASRRVRADGASPSRDAWPGEGIAGCFGTGGAIRPEQNAPPFSWAGRGVSVSTKRAHLCGDAGRGGQPLPISSAAAACTPRGAAASRFRYHVPPVRFAHRNMMFPSLQGCPSALQRKAVDLSTVRSLAQQGFPARFPGRAPGAGETCPGGKGRRRRPFSTSERPSTCRRSEARQRRPFSRNVSPGIYAAAFCMV